MIHDSLYFLLFKELKWNYQWNLYVARVFFLHCIDLITNLTSRLWEFSLFFPCSSGPLEPSGVSVHDIVLSGYPQNMIYLSCNLEGLSVLYLVQMSQPPSPLMKMSHGNYYKLWKSEIQRWRFLNSQSHFQPNLLVWLSIFFTCLEYKMNFIRKTFGDAFHYSIMYTL